MRDQAIQMAIGVTFLPRISKHGTELERRQVIQKVELIFKRLLDIVLKLDNIKTTDTGEDYLDLDSLHTDTNLADKFKSISLLWEGTGEEK